uniref:40S ribosomal protein S7 n=1 Tax=Zea mays TaxID=4577 RepID=A0A804MC77_MAIZE
MYTARKKIQKEKGLEPSEFEDSVAQELKSDLKDLYINNAIQMDVTGSRKAVVIHVPYRLRKAFRKIHVRLVRELEKKFSGKIAAMRCPLPRPPDHSDGAGSGRRWGILLASQMSLMASFSNRQIAAMEPDLVAAGASSSPPPSPVSATSPPWQMRVEQVELIKSFRIRVCQGACHKR